MAILNRNPAFLIPLALVAMAVPMAAQASQDDDTYQGEAAERYAMVRSLEGDTTIRKGEVEESLTRGTPIAEGDILESRGRGVLQLADGTRIAFDGSTRLHIAALFKNGLGERHILLRLDHGRLRLSFGGDGRLRVDTPSGTLTMNDRGTATVEASRDRTVRVRVTSGRGTFSNNRDQVRLSAGERIAVYSTEDRLDRVRTFNTYEQDAFETWADRRASGGQGESFQRVPREIRHYAHDLDEYGEWVEVDDAGWVWRPRVEVEWRPYWRGRWGAYSSGMTWVSDDPFGYVTSHFGRWGWTSRWGWYWIPGVHYAPAWVAWNMVGSNWGWAPLNYWNTPTTWGYGAWGGGHCWNVVNVNHIHRGGLNRHIYSDSNIIRSFNSNRDLRAPWTRGPVVVTQAEFRNPAQLSRAFAPEVRRDRLQAYERQIQATTGRTIVRREATGPAPAAGANPREHRIPFEDRRRDQGLERRDLVPRERSHEPRPGFPRQDATPIPPRDRSHEPRPTERREERRPEPSPARPRERGFETRPETREERRPDPPRDRPRERMMEVRPSETREERRPDPPRERIIESRPAPSTPRPERREERREERRPDPPTESRPTPPPSERRESRPAPRTEERRDSRSPGRRN